MSFDPVRATLISDFNLEVFSGYLKNDPQFPIVSPFVTPFGQVMQVLMDENMKCWEQFNDLAVVWTRPEGVINSFQKALDFRPVNFEKALEEVDASLVEQALRVGRLALAPGQRRRQQGGQGHTNHQKRAGRHHRRAF